MRCWEVSSMFYLKLATSNFKKSIKEFAPFFITTVTMFTFTSMIFLILFSPVAKTMGGTGGVALSLASIVLTIFSVIMVFYSYNFLLKQRTKEFGLYNILGMNKRQISYLATIELFISYFITIGLGSVFSVVLSKIVYIIFINIIHSNVFHFNISLFALMVSSGIFVGLFILLHLLTLFRINQTSALNLYKNQTRAEKEPKGNVILALLGVIGIGLGYYWSLTVPNQAILAITVFFKAILAVIFGTYLFFISFIAWYLKKCRNNKKYYYQPKAFITVSQMLFRMKQNAVGLASICLLACMAFVTIFSTSALYYNKEKTINNQFPRNTSIKLFNVTDRAAASQKYNDVIETTLSKTNQKTKKEFHYLTFTANGFTDFKGNLNIDDKTINTKPSLEKLKSVMYLQFMTQDDLRKSGNDIKELSDNEIAFYTNKSENNLDIKTFNFFGQTYKNVQSLTHLKNAELTIDAILSGIVVVPNDSILLKMREQINSSSPEKYKSDLAYNSYTDSSRKVYNSLSQAIKEQAINENDKSVFVLDYKADEIQNLIVFSGSFLFVGLLLGFVFLLGAGLIIYYKQLTEGQQDKESYRILQEVGMSLKQVKKTINSQIVLVFFLPLIVAITHFGFAIPLLKKLLLILEVSGGTSIYVISGLTVLGVLLTYYTIYVITSRTYYRIVER